MGDGADAAAQLHRVLRRLEDGLDGRAVDALAGKGAVEVDDVQPLEALVLEGLRLCGRIVIVDGGLAMSPSFRRTHWPSFKIDGGERGSYALNQL
jgi:hypothetical protein